MKRLLGVNDGYGTEEIRVAILDGLNALKRLELGSNDFLVQTQKTFDDLLTLNEQIKRNPVLRVALIVEGTALCGVAIRDRCQ